MRELAGTAIEHFLEVDAPIFRTFAGLTLRPGDMCREYIEGRRRRYTHPLKYAFICLSLVVLLLVVFDIQMSQNIFEVIRGSNLPDSDVTVRSIAGEEKQFNSSAFSRMVEISISYLNILSILATAAVVMFMFWNRRLHYAEHLVFCYFTIGHLALLSIVFISAGAGHSAWLLILMHIVAWMYMWWATTRFYRVPLWWSALASVAIIIVDFLFTAIAGTFMIVGYMIWKMMI